MVSRQTLKRLKFKHSEILAKLKSTGILIEGYSTAKTLEEFTYSGILRSIFAGNSALLSFNVVDSVMLSAGGLLAGNSFIVRFCYIQLLCVLRA